MTGLRIGILGAARIAPSALIEPAPHVEGVEVVAIAARDRARAEEFAAVHGIPRVLDDYTALVADDDIDAVYNPLPPAGHAPWTIAAVQAGKHVLCEKPFALSASEATSMVRAAGDAGRVVVEAFHWRYHPLAHRMVEVLRSGRLGALRHVEAVFRTPIPDTSDIRHIASIGGGAMMDLGCYPVHWVRTVAGEQPVVVSATAVEGLPGIDLSLDAELAFPGGATGAVRCSMAVDTPTAAWLQVEGADGSLRVTNPIAPHLGHRISLRLRDGTSEVETVDDPRSTYFHQLEAFVRAVQRGESALTGGGDSIATMSVIDQCYAAAGLPSRAALAGA